MAFTWGVFIAVALVSYLVQLNLQHKFAKYSRVSLDGSLTGREVAERMLRESGITTVKVVSVAGKLSDHYNPLTLTVNLSEEVYRGNSVAAAAVAAHECGHAVQHASAYMPLRLRSKLVPAVSFASRWLQWVLLAGMLLLNVFPVLMLAGVMLFALTTLFSFVTLPVEIDASRRAVAWLKSAKVTSMQNQPMAESALRAAAYTYVVAALGSLAALISYILIFLNRRD